MLKATAVPSDLALTTVPGTHTNPNPVEFVSMFAGININNCVFQFSQNPVHGMPSSMTANTDKDHKSSKVKTTTAVPFEFAQIHSEFRLSL